MKGLTDMAESRLKGFEEEIEALVEACEDGVDSALVGRIARLRESVTEVRNTAQSGNELRRANRALDKLKSVYAP